MRVLEVRGKARVMGEGIGEAFREEIQQFYLARINNAIQQAKAHGGRDVGEAQVLDAARGCLAVKASWDSEGFQEITGIARASGLSAEQIYALNGLTDIRDYLAWAGEERAGAGCSSFIVQRDIAAGGATYCGQTWDLATDNMPYVVAIRRSPEDAPDTVSVTTVGCLSLIGMNEEGLAIGTTNIRTKDARLGVCYLSVIHRALRSKTVAEASSLIGRAPRGGGHYFYVTDRAGDAAAIECTATRSDIRSVEFGHRTMCNHCLIEDHRAHEASTPRASSEARYARLDEILGARGADGIDKSCLVEALSDHSDEEGAICRHDLNGISSNAGVVMSSTALKMWACHGHPCEAEWVELLG